MKFALDDTRKAKASVVVAPAAGAMVNDAMAVQCKFVNDLNVLSLIH